MRSDRGVCNETERGREGGCGRGERDKAEEGRGEGESKRERHGMVVVESWLGYADWDGWVD